MLSKLHCLFFGHRMDSWNCHSTNECYQKRTCMTCGKKEIREIPHEWGVWKYQNPESCFMERSCDRCEKKDTKVGHIWEEPVSGYSLSPETCVQEYTCTRCGFKETKEASHNWIEVGRDGIGYDGGDYHDGRGQYWYSVKYECSNCHGTKYEETT